VSNLIETSSAIHHLPTREGYDRWAAVYDGDGNPLTALEEPHVDQLLGDVRGLRVADIGCGTGRHSIRLAVHGANVTAMDFSAGMLDKAREKLSHDAPHASIQFIQHDLLQSFPLPDQSFDRVLCGLVLEHIPNLEFVFSQMKRICRLDGGIVVSNMHPAMMLKGVTARFTDPTTGRETRPASCPHQISDYVMAAINAGMTVDHLSEHCADDGLAHRCPRAEKYLGWPLLFIMRLRP